MDWRNIGRVFCIIATVAHAIDTTTPSSTSDDATTEHTKGRILSIPNLEQNKSTTTESNSLIRKDKRCGTEYPLSDGSPSQCDPYADKFCCSKWGYCGFTSEHCECSECIDYRKVYSINTTEVTTQKADPNQVVRADGRCGSNGPPLADGRSAQCDPQGEFYCCSKWGYCGNEDDHCNCADCINYRTVNVTAGPESAEPKHKLNSNTDNNGTTGQLNSNGSGSKRPIMIFLGAFFTLAVLL